MNEARRSFGLRTDWRKLALCPTDLRSVVDIEVGIDGDRIRVNAAAVHRPAQ